MHANSQYHENGACSGLTGLNVCQRKQTSRVLAAYRHRLHWFVDGREYMSIVRPFYFMYPTYSFSSYLAGPLAVSGIVEMEAKFSDLASSFSHPFSINQYPSN